VNFTLYAELFLTALYHHSTFTNEEWFIVKDIVEEYQFPWKDIWADNLLKDLESRGVAKVRRHMGPYLGQRIAMTGAGFRHVEREQGDNVAAFLEAHGLSHSTQRQHEQPDAEPATLTEPPIPTSSGIDSTAWTGLRNVGIGAHNRRQIKGAIQQAREVLEGQALSNEQKAQALIFLKAAEDLAEAPEPPSDLIWELIARVADICGIVGLFLTIFLAAVA
jgi:hypothetical protein